MHTKKESEAHQINWQGRFLLNKLFVFCCCCGTGAIALVFFLDDLIASLSVFLVIFPVVSIVVIYIILIICSIRYLFKNLHFSRLSFLPLLILLASLVIIVFCPLRDVNRYIEFSLNEDKYIAAIDHFKDQTIVSTNGSVSDYNTSEEIPDVIITGHLQNYSEENEYDCFYFIKWGLTDVSVGVMYYESFPGDLNNLEKGSKLYVGYHRFTVLDSYGNGWYYVGQDD
ncbi:MAG: hypothetical protein LBC35_03665 [Coriobacteriales bacterium]|jgi:hypothetical protein|nr:hypothetical protein [Coriobacteriales bacterium]